MLVHLLAEVALPCIIVAALTWAFIMHIEVQRSQLQQQREIADAMKQIAHCVEKIANPLTIVQLPMQTLHSPYVDYETENYNESDSIKQQMENGPFSD